MSNTEQLQKENEIMRFIIKNHQSVAERSWAIRCHGEEGCLEPGSFWTTETVAWGVERHAVVMATGLGRQVVELDENGNREDKYFAHPSSLTPIGNPFPAGHKISQDAEWWKYLAEAARELNKIVG